ncbi:MAG: NADH-quinone oxidoreductase subunit C [Terrimonas sp.]|nr:NADH-quinone oxidoreductase subunit C [Terrimonas sp.]
MTNEELTIKISALQPALVVEEGQEWLQFHVDNKDWLALAKQLKETAGLDFDYLFCLTCVDWKTHLSMVYHLSSTLHRHTIVIKIKLAYTDPVVETVSGIWRTAEFHEREVYEMFGVDFLHHPDLRLLILPDGWEGKNPMRKDFEDPVNMIKL